MSKMIPEHVGRILEEYSEYTGWWLRTRTSDKSTPKKIKAASDLHLVLGDEVCDITASLERILDLIQAFKDQDGYQRVLESLNRLKSQ